MHVLGQRGTWEISVPILQFCYKPKTAKKKNRLNKNKQILLACESFVFTCKLFMLFSELPRGKEGI